MAESLDVQTLESWKSEGEDFVLIDVLSEEHFEEGHIPGALSIPLDHLGEAVIERLEKHQTIVVYCKDLECGASEKAAEKLEKLGFEDVYDFEGGLKRWEESGNRVE